jgi:hypothetical protein
MSNLASLSDVESIDAIIAATYDVISGPVGKKRDWDRERSLFYPGARLIPTATVPGKNDVDLAPQILDVEGYIARVEPLFEKSGFYETEIARRSEQFGRIAHVWSTYESRHDPKDPEPVHAGHQQHPAFQRRSTVVDLVDLLAARISKRPASGEISLALFFRSCRMFLVDSRWRLQMRIAVTFGS